VKSPPWNCNNSNPQHPLFLPICHFKIVLVAMATASSAVSGGPTKSTKSSAKKPTKASATKAKTPRKPKKQVGSAKNRAVSATQQAYAAARAAQMDLASIRSDAAARLLDPLWYKAEDVLPSIVDDSFMSPNAKVLPEQIQIVEAALEKNNLSRSDVTPQAFACLLEQARRYAIEILTDSQDYAFVAGRTEIGRADLLLANEFRPDHPISVSTQLPKLNLLAQTINREPLPPIPTQCYSGIMLPPKNHQLTARTFDIVTSAEISRRMIQAAPPPPHKLKMGKKKPLVGKDDKHKPSYGAARGRQISVNLKGKKPEENKKEGEGPPKLEVEAKSNPNSKVDVQATPARYLSALSTSSTTPSIAVQNNKDRMDVNEKEKSTLFVAGSQVPVTAKNIEGGNITRNDEGGGTEMEISPGKS
jgi:histone H3/H4